MPAEKKIYNRGSAEHFSKPKVRGSSIKSILITIIELILKILRMQIHQRIPFYTTDQKDLGLRMHSHAKNIEESVINITNAIKKNESSKYYINNLLAQGLSLQEIQNKLNISFLFPGTSAVHNNSCYCECWFTNCGNVAKINYNRHYPGLSEIRRNIEIDPYRGPMATNAWFPGSGGTEDPDRGHNINNKLLSEMNPEENLYNTTSLNTHLPINTENCWGIICSGTCNDCDYYECNC